MVSWTSCTGSDTGANSTDRCALLGLAKDSAKLEPGDFSWAWWGSLVWP